MYNNAHAMYAIIMKWLDQTSILYTLSFDSLIVYHAA